jgi:hypothetical protein
MGVIVYKFYENLFDGQHNTVLLFHPQQSYKMLTTYLVLLNAY